MFYNAKRLLNHYIQLCMKEQGLTVNNDTTAEIDYIFESMEDDLRDIMKEEIEKILKSGVIVDQVNEDYPLSYIEEQADKVDDLEDQISDLKHDNEKIKDDIYDLENPKGD